VQELTGKVAVVTGGASGIGLALARRFGQAGMKLALADIERGALDAAAQELEGEGFDVLPVRTDVSDAGSMDALGEAVLGRFGAAHVVCLNAGVGGGGGPLWEATHADWQFTIGVNLWGVIHGVRVFGPHLVAQDEGHFVNTASMAGLVSVPGLGPYNVTKHGVVTLSETLYGDLEQRGSKVGVSVLCPGFVSTKIYDSGRNRPEALQNAGGQRPDPKQREMARQFFETQGMPTAEVADRVHDAVVDGRFYILTHPGSEAGVTRRAETIAAGGSPQVLAPGVFGRGD
jgi:NAD(P)-dependent dehydrogenase (short-subunit alcohol dehydrogenase family)